MRLLPPQQPTTLYVNSNNCRRNVFAVSPSIAIFWCLFMLSWLRPIRGFSSPFLAAPSVLSASFHTRATAFAIGMTPHQSQPSAETEHSRMNDTSTVTTIATLEDPPANNYHNKNKQESTMIARKVTPAQLVECGARLRAGDLVAFPTETVYGLGCHALDPRAVQKVFAAKERPLTDPLIVHVSTAADAYPLWATTDDDNNDDGNNLQPILRTLCDAFWPGPLTLVARAAPQVPPIIMANTGFVACRCPLHPLAQALIQEARVPIAAPSANKFGHVSPTQADHVMDDLGQEDVWVLEEEEEEQQQQQQQQQSVACQVGVESTVAKIEVIPPPQNNDGTCNPPQQQYRYALTVLRQGAISVQDLAKCLEKAGRTDVNVASLSSRTAEETEATVAPGQTIKHYSPRIPSFLVASCLLETIVADDDASNNNDEWLQLLRQSIVLDFGGRLSAWSSTAKQYRDLSPSGDSAQAAQCVFEALRWAERVDVDAKFIVFPQVVVSQSSQEVAADALTLALHDRLTRAASGVVLNSITSIREHTAATSAF